MPSAAGLLALAACCCGVARGVRDTAGSPVDTAEDSSWEDPVDVRTEHAKLVPDLSEEDEEAPLDFVDRGCFAPSPGDGADVESEGSDGGDFEQPELRDPGCISWAEPGACRGGLAFFRKQVDSSSPQDECLKFCLSQGLDLFGLVLIEPGLRYECRCGTTALNSEFLRGKQPRAALQLPAPAEQPPSDPDQQQQLPTESCRVRIWQFSPSYVSQRGHTPLKLLGRGLDDEIYLDSVVRGHDTSQDNFEDGLGESPAPAAASGASLLQDGPGESPANASAPAAGSGGSLLQHGPGDKPVQRDCASRQCAGGKAWGPKIYLAFTPNVGRTTKTCLLRAASMISKAVHCISFYELDPDRTFEESDFAESRYSTVSPLAGTILIDSKGEDSGCYTAGAGWPGEYGMRYVNLGWCNGLGQEGTMIHELGHALGLDHEQKRLDAFKQVGRHGPYNKLLIGPEHENYDQYEPSDHTFMGSVGLGGHTPFDYDSIMMYPAGDRYNMVTRPYSIIRRPGWARLIGQHDHRTGQRKHLSTWDIIQLEDMYGCLQGRERWLACPTFAAQRQVDGDGDCSCPGGAQCLDGDSEGCPQTSGATSDTWFASTCTTCVCKRPTCPASARRSSPERGGWCACEKEEVCMRFGRVGCPSPQSHHDPKAFWSTCSDCECRADTCPQAAGGVDEIPDLDGDCQCGKDQECWSGGTKGCTKRDGDVSHRYSAAACKDCLCRPRTTPWVAEEVCLGEVQDRSPDGEGDCKCKDGFSCKQGRLNGCESSAGYSKRFFKLSCKSCKCVPTDGSQVLGMELYEAHQRCNTKCGAKIAGRWSLDALNLGRSSCGRCFEFQQASKSVARCSLGAGTDMMRKNYDPIDSGSTTDFCCQEYRCNLKDGCFGGCGENAECVHRGQPEAVCVCQEGFEQDPNVPPVDGLRCVEKVPPGARCCHDGVGNFMWFPKNALKSHWFPLNRKKICPSMDGKKWHHSKNDADCEKKRQVFAEGAEK